MKGNLTGTILKIAIPVALIGGAFVLEHMFNDKAENFTNSIKVISENNSQISIVDDKPLEIVDKKSYGNIQGMSENYGFISNNEILVGIGLNKEEFYKKYTKDSNKMTREENDNAYEDMYGKIYKIKLDTLEKTPIKVNNKLISNRLVMAGLSPDRTKFNFHDLSKVYNYNLTRDNFQIVKDVNIAEEEEHGNWSQDSKYFIGYKDGDLELYNIETRTTKIVKVKSDNLYISAIPSFYSENGEEIYFIGEEKQKSFGKGDPRRQGIYKVNSNTGKIQDVMILPYVDRTSNKFGKSNYKENCIPSVEYYVLDEGKRILFEGILDDVDGTYIYDVEKKEFHTAITHIDSKEGSFSSPCYLSPDKTKVAYMNRANENGKEVWNLYAAKINGNSFTSRVLIKKDINLASSLSNVVQWSQDSKKILFFNTDKVEVKNGFAINDKSVVNLITFK
ncbi:hypothetical protein JOC70_002753 [Clostridium pascui]|uniref:hypothetical protein n=1 Tax=Clostridium pascui TaxID=46609 RepID=UPI00195A03C6|nr:hypothetical protein [Clostridium pascui]MBM7871255.1 hypothetical protein [Clostridium pascui]